MLKLFSIYRGLDGLTITLVTNIHIQAKRAIFFLPERIDNNSKKRR